MTKVLICYGDDGTDELHPTCGWYVGGAQGSDALGLIDLVKYGLLKDIFGT